MDWREHFMRVFNRDRWSWAELERQTKIDASQIQRWVTTTTEPALDTAILLANVMDIGLDELFLGQFAPIRIDAIARKLVAEARKTTESLEEEAGRKVGRALVDGDQEVLEVAHRNQKSPRQLGTANGDPA